MDERWAFAWQLVPCLTWWWTKFFANRWIKYGWLWCFIWKPKSTVLAVLTEAANLFLCPLFCRGCTWILQQVCAFYLFSVCSTLFFSSSSLWKLISSLVFDGFALLSSNLCWHQTVQEKKKNCCCHVQSCRSHLTALTITPPPPSVRLSPRLSDLSLRSMHLCPIPDAKAHGKDGYHCPEQLCVPNGEVSQCFLFTGIQAL